MCSDSPAMSSSDSGRSLSAFMPEILKVPGGTYTTRSLLQLPPTSPSQPNSRRKSDSMLACRLAESCFCSAMPLDAAHAIWADTGFNYSGSQILSQSFAMICGALVPHFLQICLDKEPDTKVAATHRRSVMSYLRELLQCKTRARRRCQYDRQATPVRSPCLRLF